MMTLNVQPLQGPLGAFVYGWDLASPLSALDREAILQALHEYLVLVFRGQPYISDADLISFAGQFGELLRGSAFLESARKHPEILHVGNLESEDGKPRGAGGAYNIDWHSDYSYAERVGKISFLNAVELPKQPPHTYFVSQYRALETLAPATIDRLRQLRAFHSTANYGNRGGVVDQDRLRADVVRDQERGVERPPIPEAAHPIVVEHPDTGRELLYISRALVDHIVGVSPAEGDALIADLCAHSTQPEAVYAHDWEIGDLVMFDTLATLHKRDAWDPRERRHMRQLSTVCRID